MDKIHAILIEHPHYKLFHDEPEEKIYIFKEKEGMFKIIIPKVFSIEENTPISFFSSEQLDIIQEFPDWYKKIYLKTFEMYYKKHRIRYLMEFGRRNFDDIVWIHSFFIKDGFNFYKEVNTVNKDGELYIDKKWKEEFEKLKPRFEKEGYHITFINEQDKKIYYKVQ